MAFYTNYVVLTNTPADLRDFLIARSVIKSTTDSEGNNILIGVLPGMEWVQVPNPIVTNPGPPPTYDSRRVYLVKFSADSEGDEEAVTQPSSSDPDQTIFNKTKLGQWVKNNSTIINPPSSWAIGGIALSTSEIVYKVSSTAVNVWVVRDKPYRFGVWV